MVIGNFTNSTACDTMFFFFFFFYTSFSHAFSRSFCAAVDPPGHIGMHSSGGGMLLFFSFFSEALSSYSATVDPSACSSIRSSSGDMLLLPLRL